MNKGEYTRHRRTKIRQKERKIQPGYFLTLAHHSWFGETVLVPRRFFLFSSAGVAHLSLFVRFKSEQGARSSQISRNLKKKTEILADRQTARSLEYGTAKVLKKLQKNEPRFSGKITIPFAKILRYTFRSIYESLTPF